MLPKHIYLVQPNGRNCRGRLAAAFSVDCIALHILIPHPKTALAHQYRRVHGPKGLHYRDQPNPDRFYPSPKHCRAFEEVISRVHTLATFAAGCHRLSSE